MMAALVAVPCAIFGLPAAVGVTWLVSDNLIQNYPLRVLVGTDLRHGHAPVWDPYLWSGSPLLSAFNAGAAYPATWLFSVLPGALAWVVNQALVEVVAAAGMVVLLRVLGRSWAASGLGAVAFAYGGFMAAQSVHIDIVEAGAWLPWAFAALDRLANRPEGRSAGPWVAMLGASIGLMGLSGAAEPILDGGVVLAVYALWLLWRAPARRLPLLLTVAAGVALGLALAGAQLIPGAFAQAQSQRAVHEYTYFVSGSMNKSLTVLGLDPLLLGTSGLFPLHFYATYSLAEVSSYIGIMPVMGLVGLLARRHRRSAEAHRWWIWYAVGGHRAGADLGWVHSLRPRPVPPAAVQPPAPAVAQPLGGRPGIGRAVRDLARSDAPVPVAVAVTGRGAPRTGGHVATPGDRREPGGGGGCPGPRGGDRTSCCR